MALSVRKKFGQIFGLGAHDGDSERDGYHFKISMQAVLKGSVFESFLQTHPDLRTITWEKGDVFDRKFGEIPPLDFAEDIHWKMHCISEDNNWKETLEDLLEKNEEAFWVSSCASSPIVVAVHHMHDVDAHVSFSTILSSLITYSFWIYMESNCIS